MVARSLANVQGNTQLALVPPVEGGIATAHPLTQPPYSLQYIYSDVNPAFSRNGKYVAFSRLIQDLLSGNIRTEIRIIDVTNPGDRQGQLVVQFSPGYFVGNLNWSADGSRLVFDAQTQFGDAGLWIYNGFSVCQLPNPPARNPSWDWGSGAASPKC
jgi:dipeptidyl aminopeptidase/acylaminoacyl peptidase